MPKLYPSLRARFDALTRRHPCGCLLWQGKPGSNGYGKVTVERRTRAAHHVAWFLEHGCWPGFLLHSCDTPLCVEVDHLSEGDATSNNADRDAKGRQARGEKTNTAVLTEADVFDIRWAREQGARTIDLAAVYGVAVSNISMICNRHSWRHL